MENALTVSYKSLSGVDVTLTKETVINSLVRGNGRITEQEVMFFLRTCEAKRLDPLENGEVYLVKYGDSQPAQMVIGVHAYLRRADANPNYIGFKAGIVVERKGSIDRKEGCALYPQLGETLLGGWCKVYKAKGANIAETYSEVSLSEYSSGKSTWTSKPATMIRKVAISQAHRDAFPNEYEGIYTEDEMLASGAIPCAPNSGAYSHAGANQAQGQTTTGAEERDATESAVGATAGTIDTDPERLITKAEGKQLVKAAKDAIGEEMYLQALKGIVTNTFGYASMGDIRYKDYEKILLQLGNMKPEESEEPAAAPYEAEYTEAPAMQENVQ